MSVPATVPEPEGGPSVFRTPGGDPERVALSLASIRDNGVWPSSWSWDGCERRVTELRDAASERVAFVGCGAWICAVCGPRRSRRLSSAVAWARPTTFGRLSQMPEDFQRTREQMRDLRRRLTDRFGVVEWSWVRHRNPKLTGYHVHFLGRMPWIPQRELQSMTGGRIPWIQAARQELGSSDYLLGIRERRGASGYLLKRSAAPEFYLDHLELNNGRPLHWSREFFKDPETGEVVSPAEAQRRSAPRSGVWYYPGRPNPPDWSKVGFLPNGLDRGSTYVLRSAEPESDQGSLFGEGGAE